MELLRLSQAAVGRRRRSLHASLWTAGIFFALALIAAISAGVFIRSAREARTDVVNAKSTVTSVAVGQTTAEAVATATLAAVNQELQEVQVTVTAASNQVTILNSEAESIRLANSADALVEEDPELAMMLANYALINQVYTADAESILREALQTLRIEQRITHGVIDISEATFSPDGRYVAVGSQGGQIVVIDLDDASHSTMEITLDDWITALDFSPENSAHLFSADYLGNMLIVDVEQKQVLLENTAKTVLNTAADDDFIRDAAFHPDGKHVAVSTSDDQLHVFDWQNAQVVNQEAFTDSPRNLTYSQDGQYLFFSRTMAEGNRDQFIVWDGMLDQQVTDGTDVPGSGGLTALAVSPTNKYVATATRSDDVVREWDISDLSQITLRFEMDTHTSRVESLAYAEDDDCLASMSHDQKILIWQEGLLYRSLLGHDSLMYAGKFGDWNHLNSDPLDLAHCPGFASVGDDDAIMFWNLTDGYELLSIHAHDGWIEDLATSHNGRFLASSGNDDVVRIWDLENFSLFTTLQHTVTVRAASFSLDDEYVATAMNNGDMIVWDVRTGSASEVWRQNAHADSVTAIAFSPTENNILATAGMDDMARLWNMDSEEMIEDWHVANGDGVLSIAFSPSGNELLTGSRDGWAARVNLVTGQGSLYGDADTLAFHQIGILEETGHLLTVDSDGMVKIWSEQETESTTRTPQGEFALHDGPIYDFDLSPSGLLATGGSDGRPTVWSFNEPTEYPDLQIRLPTVDSSITDVAWINDRILAVGGRDGRIRLFQIDWRELLETVQARITRSFTEAECIRYDLNCETK